MINLLPQLLLDYNDLQKLPFYDMLDKVLTRDGLKLRFAAQIQKSLFFSPFPFWVLCNVLMQSFGFEGLIPWGSYKIKECTL